MMLKEAKQLRDAIRAVNVRCIVPLGCGPSGYFARIFPWDEKQKRVVPLDFYHRKQWDEYHAKQPKPALTSWRVVIETLMLPTGSARTADEAVQDQHPITDWLDSTEAYNLLVHLRARMPLNHLGLLYGHQVKRDEGKRIDVEGELVKIRADVMGYFERKEREEAERRHKAELAVREFVDNYSPEAHVVGQILERLAD